MFLPLCISFLAVSIVYYYWRVSKYPKGPLPLPFLGNALQVIPNKLHFQMEEWKRVYGNVFTVWILNTPMVFLMDYHVVKEALVDKGDIFLDRSGMFAEDILQFVPNGGVVFSSGQNWREQRKLSMSILKELGVGQSILEDMIYNEMDKFFVEMEKLAEKEGPVDFHWPIHILISNIINNLLFGFSYPFRDSDRLLEYAQNINVLLKEIAESPMAYIAQVFPIFRKIPLIGYWTFGKHKERYRLCIEHVKSDVATALQNFQEDDQPVCFVQAYFKAVNASSCINTEQLYNVCADFFLAGMETTSTTLRWALLYLASNTSAQDRMRQEIYEVVGVERYPSMRDRSRMPYTIACIAEVQRAANIIPITIMHKNSSDVVIGDAFIPAGSVVVPQVYSILFDEDLFPQAREFLPERFLNEDDSLDKELVNKMVAFGMGKRQCAGETLAKAELFVCLTRFIQKFEVLPANDAPIELDPLPGTVLFPKSSKLEVRFVGSEK